jgi:biotin carboxyl carrier protein
MTRQFKITVDGTTYDVTVDEQDTGAPTPPASTAARAPTPLRPAATSATAPSPEPAAPAPAAESGGGLGDVVSPLAGTVVEVHVKAGEAVNQGQPVVTLEAMKMNTAVTASRSGTVKNVAVQAGLSVAEGQVLLSID